MSLPEKPEPPVLCPHCGVPTREVATLLGWVNYCDRCRGVASYVPRPRAALLGSSLRAVIPRIVFLLGILLASGGAIGLIAAQAEGRAAASAAGWWLVAGLLLAIASLLSDIRRALRGS